MKLLPAGLAVGMALQPAALLACPACYGQSDSPLAKGMNWGIFSLPASWFACCVASLFFVYLAEGPRPPPRPPAPPPPESTQKR